MPGGPTGRDDGPTGFTLRCAWLYLKRFKDEWRGDLLRSANVHGGRRGIEGRACLPVWVSLTESPLRSLLSETSPIANRASRHGPGNGPGGHFKKEVVWGREGLESRSERKQTRFIFKTSIPLIREHLAARARKSWQTASALGGKNISAAKTIVCDLPSRKHSPTCASGVCIRQ